MLPFNKRSRETQVSTALPRFPLTSHSALAYRPQLDSFSDDERTRVMTRSSRPPPLPSQRRATPPPPTPSQKAQAAARPIRCYPPKPSMDEATKSAFHAPPPPRVAMFDIPPLPPPPADMAVVSPPHPSSTSDLPPAVITSTTKISFGRPTPSWAAALVALGVFAGLVTAVLARGDGDALVHAGAQLVDPTHQAGAAQAVIAGPAFPQPTAVIAQPTITTPTPMTPVAVKACAEDKVAKDVKDDDAKPEPKARPVAKAPIVQAQPAVVKPQPPPVVQKVAAKTASPKDPIVAAPKPAPKAAKASADDGASAADALAKAQLEAALGR